MMQECNEIVRCIISVSSYRSSSVPRPIGPDGVKMLAEALPRIVPRCGMQNAIMYQHDRVRRGATFFVVQLRPIHFEEGPLRRCALRSRWTIQDQCRC